MTWHPPPNAPRPCSRSSMPAAHSQHWREYCAQPLLAKQFQRMDCAAEVCAIVKHRSPAPPGYSFN